MTAENDSDYGGHIGNVSGSSIGKPWCFGNFTVVPGEYNPDKCENCMFAVECSDQKDRITSQAPLCYGNMQVDIHPEDMFNFDLGQVDINCLCCPVRQKCIDKTQVGGVGSGFFDAEEYSQYEITPVVMNDPRTS